ncbi:MAG: oligoendopeptidase F [Acholeplasmatales bacterium]|jgi:oligoendopeptidase F|nr:oligoendopeptidase F [Acholeplasmatales bacterium]
MEKKNLKRSEVNPKYTWDLTRIFKTEEDYCLALDKVVTDAKALDNKYRNKLNNEETINQALNDVRKLYEAINYVSSYNLYAESDATDEKNLIRRGKFGLVMNSLSPHLSFLDAELKLQTNELLNKAASLSKDNSLTLKKIIKNKLHSPSYEVEVALSSFSDILYSPYNIYNAFKITDIKFDSFKIGKKTYDLSFNSFENNYEYIEDNLVREKAFSNFYKKLGEYQNGFSEIYNTCVLNDKAQSKLNGFSSVFDYLLYEQDVTKEMYDRQIDVITDKLRAPMRKYVSLLKEVYKLDKVSFCDLKLSLDPEFEPKISIKEASNVVINGLGILGNDYRNMIKRAFKERWIDFPQTIGKSTGGFCSSLYRNGSFILLNWNGLLEGCYVLAHELGHAGHQYYAGNAQNSFDTNVSSYMVEAPSTMNEILLANQLYKDAKDSRMKRFVLSSSISRTYYHNFITHLLEAAYQREVYKKVDNGEPLSANVLNNIYLKVLRDFWGEDVYIPSYAGLTWMRQPHYYMGLYSYTYSAGLTVATATSEKILKGDLTIDQWIKLLSAGGTLSPRELALLVNCDLSTEQPLLETINHIADMVEEIIKLTKELKSNGAI